MSLQKSISSLLPYFILSIIVVGLARSSGERDDCSPSCGSQNISYPFRLRGDPPTCGLPEYELICGGNKTILELHGGRYYVTAMLFDTGENGRIQVADANLATGQCKLPFLFPYRSVNLPYEIIGGSVEEESNWASFVNCSNKVQDDTYQAVSCRFLSMVPTFYYRDRASSEAQVFQSLKGGFFLGWEATFKPSQIINHCLKNSLGFPCLQVELKIFGSSVRSSRSFLVTGIWSAMEQKTDKSEPVYTMYRRIRIRMKTQHCSSNSQPEEFCITSKQCIGDKEKQVGRKLSTPVAHLTANSLPDGRELAV